MLYLKTGILSLTMLMFSPTFVQAGKMPNLVVTSHRDPNKTYIVIYEDIILQTANRAFSWRVPAGTVVEKIKTAFTTDELWLVESLEKGRPGGRKAGVISLKVIQEMHHLIAQQKSTI